MTTNDRVTATPPSPNIIASGSDPAGVFTTLAEILYRGAEASEVYSAICVAATLLVPGCDHASLMLRRGGEHATVAATDDVALLIDDLERQLGEGPCLDAIEEEAPQIEPDLTSGSPWPRLAPMIVESTPVRGAMGFRLLIDEHKVGALNLFADGRGTFTSAAVAHASVLAAFASITVTAVSRGQDIVDLRSGLASNREIGQAIGLLMATERVSADAAFDVLRRTSQQVNLKVVELARQIVGNFGTASEN